MRTLLDIRRHIAENIERMPRYLCTEMVTRKMLASESFSARAKPASCGELSAAMAKPGAKKQLFSVDRLRLDVAVINRAETYSWVGAAAFDDRSLTDLVKRGTTSTGTFSAFVTAIFGTDNASFAFKDTADFKGRRALNYTFSVPLWRSGYRISNGLVQRLTAYRGMFSADAETFDLLHLEIYADSLAEDLEMCETSTILDYSQVRLNNVDFLLPTQATTRVLSADGLESENRTDFSGCHQFMGESKLFFDDPAASADVTARVAANSVVLPPGVKMRIALTQAIDPASDAAGDAVKGRLVKAVPVEPLGLTIPKGTPVNGRIYQLLMQYVSGNFIELGLTWETFEFGGVKHKVDLSLKSVVAVTTSAPYISARWPEPGSPLGILLFANVTKKYKIAAGLESEWVTK